MAHPLRRDPRHRGAECEHITVITGGGPNKPRVMLMGLAAWVTSPYGSGGWSTSGLVPACLRVTSASVRPLTAAEALSAATNALFETRMRLGRQGMAGRILMQTGSDPASVDVVQRVSGTAGVNLVGRAYALVHGNRDPITYARDPAGADMIGAAWLTSRVDALLPREAPGVERGWPYVHQKIVVDLSQLAADGEGALTSPDLQQALAGTDRLIRPEATADVALAVTSPSEAVSAALMLALVDMDRIGPYSGWSTPQPPAAWRP
jgi:hypothetical protein